MIENARNSEGSTVGFDSSKMTAPLEEIVSSGRASAVQSELDMPTLSPAGGISNVGTVADIATKIFRARITEALTFLSNATKEWNEGSTTWLNSIQMARDALEELIRFDDY